MMGLMLVNVPLRRRPAEAVDRDWVVHGQDGYGLAVQVFGWKLKISPSRTMILQSGSASRSWTRPFGETPVLSMLRCLLPLDWIGDPLLRAWHRPTKVV